MDKPAGITSHDVVDRVRKIFGTRRVGHTGTLDPRATGLLVLLLGEATKISEYLMGLDKSYEGTMKLGVTSDSFDMDTELRPGGGKEFPRDLEKLQDLAAELTGEIDQVPPAYSAKKVGGKKLYEYARAGESPEVEPRKVRIDDFEILTLEDDLCEFGVDCSSGTYVRSIVHDFGEKLGCGAVLAELRRTDVGPFGIEDAWTLEGLENLEGKSDKLSAIIPIRRALAHMLTVYLASGAETWIRRGQAIPHNMVQTEDDAYPGRASTVVLTRLNGHAVALARVDPAPMSPPPRAMYGAVAPWYQPIKQFEIPVSEDE